MLQIKTSCTQLGLCVEASHDGGPWYLVQLTKYKDRASSSVAQYSSCIDPAKDREEYLESLRQKKIEFVHIRE